MKSNPRVSKILVESGAYRDLGEPVILAGGDLGIYFVNTEKILQDDDEWKKFGGCPQGMIQHAIRVMQENGDFREVINALVDKVKEIEYGKERPMEGDPYQVFSGGQRRDWLFSGPVAYMLNCKHVALFKDGKALLLSPDAQEILDFGHINRGELYSTHVSDLVTKGSSAYDPGNAPPTGWIPMLRERAIEVENLVAVVDRLQGGEEILAQTGVNLHTLVDIDKEFTDEHSKQPEVARVYLEDDRAWGKGYIRIHGIGALVGTFDPSGGKLKRCRNFLRHYDDILIDSGRLQELAEAVQKEYGITLDKIKEMRGN